MSERYGVALTAIGDRVFEYGWCAGSDHKRDFVGTREEAQTYASAINEKLPGNRYEIRPYPAPEAKPVSRLDSVDWECPGCGMWSPAARGWRLHAKDCTWTNAPAAVVPSAIRHVQQVDAGMLAFSLFASDPAVEAFVAARAENADRYEATLRIAFDRDENGWATHARNRAARVIARMAK